VTINEQFLASVLPEPVRLLGQWLRPYSVGHEILLQRHENVFRSGAAADDLTIRIHLFMGVFLCCQTWAENMAATQDDSIHKKILKWQKRCGKFSLIEKSEVFAKYISAGWPLMFASSPVKQKHSRPTPTPGAPLLAMLQLFQLRRLGLSVNDAMDMPISNAWNLFLTHAEQEGAVRIYSQADKEQDDLVRQAAKARGLQLIKRRK
jgi:hypothetical protein